MIETHLINHATVPCVCLLLHVALQVIRLSETWFALLTSIRLFPIVLLRVFLQVTRPSDILLTLLTIIRLLSTVCTHVCFQVTRLSKTRLTLLTSIRLLPSVYAYVSSGHQIQRKYSCIADKHKASPNCASADIRFLYSNSILHFILEFYLKFTFWRCCSPRHSHPASIVYKYNTVY